MPSKIPNPTKSQITSNPKSHPIPKFHQMPDPIESDTLSDLESHPIPNPSPILRQHPNAHAIPNPIPCNPVQYHPVITLSNPVLHSVPNQIPSRDSFTSQAVYVASPTHPKPVPSHPKPHPISSDAMSNLGLSEPHVINPIPFTLNTVPYGSIPPTMIQ